MKPARKIQDDPIVAQVRQARADLFAESGNDLRKLFSNINRRSKTQAATAAPARAPRRRSAKPKRAPNPL